MTYRREKGPHAFPSESEYHSYSGMTLLDWFAGQALSNSSICKVDDEYPQRTAYAFAHAMLVEREEQ